MNQPVRNRIKGHIQIRAADLVPHELNPRVHSQDQRDALAAIYKEVGIARSLLGYELPDGRIKLIDGHLRQAEHQPDDLVDVEVLDVTDAEARKLLLTIDPLASLASYSDAQLLSLRDLTIADDQTLNALWASLHQADPPKLPSATDDKPEPTIRSQWLIIIECPNEQQQATYLAVCKTHGMVAKAVTS
jgi:ParB-like chromosome segregation protein Spo0J